METQQTLTIKFFGDETFPVEMHKVRIVQKLFLRLVEDRLTAINEAGYNTFLLNTKDVFLDMLTDSGTNAMSDNQVSSMSKADDADLHGTSCSCKRLARQIGSKILGRFWQ